MTFGSIDGRCLQARFILSAGVVSSFDVRGWNLASESWGAWKGVTLSDI